MLFLQSMIQLSIQTNFHFSCHERVDGQSRTLLANSTTTAIFAVLFVLLTILSIWLYLERRKLTKQLNRDYNSRMVPLQQQQQQQQSDDSERTRLNAPTRITQ
jgi:hypothetical protein